MITSAPTVPREVIDPHIHQWDPLTTPRHATTRARLLRPAPRVPGVLLKLASQAERELVGHPHHMLKPYLPANYRRDVGAMPVTAVVHVEAEWVGATPVDGVDETRWVADLPFGEAGTPRLGAVIAKADPRWPDIGRVLDAHLAADSRVRGIRYSASHHPDSGVRSFADSGTALQSPAFLTGFEAVAERNLSFELWMYSHQFAAATRLVSAFPQTTFVLNHYATPVGIFGPRGRRTGQTPAEREALRGQLFDDLAALAEHPNVVAKHSGLGMPVLGGTPRRPFDTASLAEHTDRAAPLVRHLHDCFGVDRTMWASNYPMDKPVLSIPATAQVLLDVLGHDAEPQRLFHDNAANTYRIGTHHADTTSGES